jgi:hypothetical protein
LLVRFKDSADSPGQTRGSFSAIGPDPSASDVRRSGDSSSSGLERGRSARAAEQLGREPESNTQNRTTCTHSTPNAIRRSACGNGTALQPIFRARGISWPAVTRT